MAKCYPDTNPYADKHPDIAEAYRRGWNHGHGFACHNVPKLHTEIFTDSMGWVIVDAENIREVHESLCFAAESHSRSYSPFEYIAQEFNEAGEGGWLLRYEHEDSDEDAYDVDADLFKSWEEARAAADSEWAEPVRLIRFPSADELWEAFDSGIADAIRADLSEYTDEDYGIESDAA